MKIRIRFGDMMIKGKNKIKFIQALNRHITRAFKDKEVMIDKRHDLTYLDFKKEDLEEVVGRIKKIPGIYAYSIEYKTEKTIDAIIEMGVYILKYEQLDPNKTFKIETKRSDKSFEYDSLTTTKLIASSILKGFGEEVKIDVKNPDHVLMVDIRLDGAYLHLTSYKGMGGFPFGMAGKGLVLLSGGIDSPVASYLAMKQGLEIELFHFESTPMTPLESVQKTIDLAKKLAQYVPKRAIKLHVVPFMALHQALLENVRDSYIITIMRRMMYRLAERYALDHKMKCIITGESIGQVASQTLDSMIVIEQVTRLPIIRPVVTYDKEAIITISKEIDTYDISIRKFNDCCSIYVPKHPVIHPKESVCLYEESKISASYLDDIYHNIMTLEVHADSTWDISAMGFDAKDAIDVLKESI